MLTTEKKRRGRPKGSKNKPKNESHEKWKKMLSRVKKSRGPYKKRVVVDPTLRDIVIIIKRGGR